MPFELDDSGLTRFLAGLDAALDAAADETADDVVELARQLAPIDEGDFRDSIEQRPGDAEGERKVVSDGNRAPHNIYVEFGQPNNTAYPAQPTLGPAADAIDPGFRAAEQLRALAAKSKV